MNASMTLRKINVGLEAKYVCKSYFKLKVPQTVYSDSDIIYTFIFMQIIC